MYLVALSLSSEMTRFAGGPKAFADSLRGGVEAMRPLRWPADRLDTLGGYLWYHNVTLFTLFLTIYAAVQGARAVRGGEDAHSLEEILATGWSRAAVIRDRAAGFAITLLLITVGVGLGIAASMAAAGEPDFGGSIISATAAGLCALVGYSLGLLLSQLTATSRAAAGMASIVITLLYLGTNTAGELGPLGAVRFISPFDYSYMSRALVPNFGFDAAASLILLLAAGLLVGLAAWAFQQRDYRSSLWARQVGAAPRREVRVQRPALRTIWTATLFRHRFGLVVWCLSAAAYSSLLAAMWPSVRDVWSSFESFASVAGGKAGISPSRQYLSLAAEIVTPIVAAYVVTQAAGWVADLDQGRVEAVLAGPVSWSKLVWERLVAAVVGVAALTVAALGALTLAAIAVGVDVDPAGLARTAVGCVLLGAALSSVAAIIVAALRTGVAVAALAAYVAASYLLGLLISYLTWPEWITKLSIFGAFGHPYLGWPAIGGTLVLLTLALGGALVAAATAERTPKVA